MNIFKSKLAIFTLFVLPLLIVLGLCISFNVFGFQNIRLVYYKNINNEGASKTFYSILEIIQSKNYVLSEVNDKEICIENVKTRKAHICMIAESFSEEELNVNIYVDETRLNLAYALINQLSQIIQIKSEEISINWIQAIIEVIEMSEKKAWEAERKLNEMGRIFEEMESEKIGLEENIKNIDTRFNIQEFELSDLKSLVEQLENTNASHLMDEFDSVIEKIRSKLEQIKKRFEEIEGKKDTALNTNQKIGFLISTSKQLRQNVYDDVYRIDEGIRNIRIRNVSILTSPIKTNVKAVSIPQKNIDYALPQILGFIMMTLSLFFSSMIIIKERKSKAYFRNFLCPIKDSTFIFSSYVFLMLIVFVELFLIIFLISRFTELIDKFFLLNFIPLLLVSLTTFIFLGMFIGYLTQREEICILIIFLILLGFLFFSSMIMPTEFIKSTVAKSIIAYLPLNIIENSLRNIIFFRFSIQHEVLSILLLLAYSIFFFFLTFLIKKLTRHQLIYI